MNRRTVTMNWDGLGEEDDDDRFFESRDRISSAVPLDLASSDDDEEFQDSRMSFASAYSCASIKNIHDMDAMVAAAAKPPSVLADYNMWMAEPGDIKERRKRLLQGMGLASNKNFVKLTSNKVSAVPRAVSRKPEPVKVPEPKPEAIPAPEEPKTKEVTLPATPFVLIRSRSDGDILTFSIKTKQRKEELIGPVSKQRLTRTSSGQLVASTGVGLCVNNVRSPKRPRNRSSIPNSDALSSILTDGAFGSFFLIKNLDTGNEFIVKEYNEEGMWNKLSDLQTGKQLTMEEFEKSVGYSPVVKELMRRENGTRSFDDSRKFNANYFSKSFRNSKRRTASLLRNLKGSMSGLIADKEREQQSSPLDPKGKSNANSQWVKVRHHGKSYREFTALHMSQEIQAHEGSIWTMKFSSDGHYLASAGEDRNIHVWEVQECEIMSTKSFDDCSSTHGTPVHPMAGSFAERPLLAELTPMPSEKRKKGKSSKKKGNSIPDYVSVPEGVFGLSEKPFCTFKGHQDDVLDLSWSQSQQLLSSSMDKTVRLWDLESKSCLKMFAHNDYVTCIQFNPVDDDYFISGSLDAKVRIWNVSARQVVDWTDLHEMVTAACYTPDGQGAIIGSHKGSCRLYDMSDCKLEQKEQFDIQNKKKAQVKKVTGFQYAPWNPAEVMITSADSRIRIYSGLDIAQKFRGFRNTSSQIAASFSPEGKYVISASEDSHVYIWKVEEKGKGRLNGQAHEHFQCKDVSVAIPWPGSSKNEPPLVELRSKKHASKRSSSASLPAVDSPTREDTIGASGRKHLPPLPKKNTNNNNNTNNTSCCNNNNNDNTSNTSTNDDNTNNDDDDSNNDNTNGDNENNTLEITTSCAEEEFDTSANIDPGIGTGESFGSSAGSMRCGESPSISASASASGSSHSPSWSGTWSLFDGGSSHGHAVQATAWGLVIVTASLSGEIRVYQNFGLPLKVGRQANLFRDLT